MGYDNKEFARMMGEFYLDKNKGDYKKTHEEIAELRITRIDYNFRTLNITIGRPGLIIGMRGENIDKLREYLKSQLKFSFELKIIEDSVIPHLYPLGCGV